MESYLVILRVGSVYYNTKNQFFLVFMVVNECDTLFRHESFQQTGHPW